MTLTIWPSFKVMPYCNPSLFASYSFLRYMYLWGSFANINAANVCNMHFTYKMNYRNESLMNIKLREVVPGKGDSQKYHKTPWTKDGLQFSCVIENKGLNYCPKPNFQWNVRHLNYGRGKFWPCDLESMSWHILGSRTTIVQRIIQIKLCSEN